MSAIVAWLLKNPLAGLLAIAVALLGFQTLRLSWEQTARANDKAAQAAAVIAAQKAADKLSDELVIQQAIAMGATTTKANTHVNEVKAAGTDDGRNRAGSLGVRDLVRGVKP